ncbi:hypothetical protein IMZ48_14770 [Candidatus Bathyarchaeota archaeon]|nr:hypothetical protein [Candidatus Bathyarchaeota archaeon]
MWKGRGVGEKDHGGQSRGSLLGKTADPRTRFEGSLWSGPSPDAPDENHEARQTLSEEQNSWWGAGEECAGSPVQMPTHYCQAKLPKRVFRPVIRRAEAEDASSGVSAGEAAAGGGRLGSWLDAAAFSRPGAGCASGIVDFEGVRWMM